jgi:hypothetical protein
MAAGPEAPAGLADPRNRRRRRWALAGVLAVALAAAVVATAPRLLDGAEYAHVATIEHTRTFRDPRLLDAAWKLPVASRYGRADFEYQSNPSYCGPASVANVLRSLGVTTSQKQIVQDTEHESWFGVLPGGLTLDELAALLQLRTARPVTIVRRTDLEQFRTHMRRSNDPARRYIVNFHRGPLFARDEYQPFLVETPRLWEATQTVDGATGRVRGLLVLDAGDAGRDASLREPAMRQEDLALRSTIRN